MWKIVLLVLVGLAILAAVIVWYGRRRWEAATRDLDARLDAAAVRPTGEHYDERELENLPLPVQQFFRAALSDGHPIVHAVRIDHAGTFNQSGADERWKPFTSTQRVVTKRPGFLWDARIEMAPGMTVRVHDAYVNGEGMLHASLFGMFTVAKMRGTPEIAEGELMRFLAEAAWYPTALLPSQGTRWDAVDADSAKATLTDGRTTIALTFRFNPARLIDSVRADARGRTVGQTIVPTPWEGRWTRYELRNGIRVPTQGEVAWLLPEGRKPYWRGQVTAIEHDFAER